MNGLNAAKQLFELPLSTKNEVRIGTSKETLITIDNESFYSEAIRGYLPFGTESGLVNKYFEAKEGYSYGYNNRYNVDSNYNSLNNVCEGEFDIAVNKLSRCWASFPCADKGGNSFYSGQPSHTLEILRNFYISIGGQLAGIE